MSKVENPLAERVKIRKIPSQAELIGWTETDYGKLEIFENKESLGSKSNYEKVPVWYFKARFNEKSEYPNQIALVRTISEIKLKKNIRRLKCSSWGYNEIKGYE